MARAAVSCGDEVVGGVTSGVMVAGTSAFGGLTADAFRLLTIPADVASLEMFESASFVRIMNMSDSDSVSPFSSTNSATRLSAMRAMARACDRCMAVWVAVHGGMGSSA